MVVRSSHPVSAALAVALSVLPATVTTALAGTPPIYQPTEIGWEWIYSNDKITDTVTIELPEPQGIELEDESADDITGAAVAVEHDLGAGERESAHVLGVVAIVAD